MKLSVLKLQIILYREVDRQKTLFKDMQDHMDEMRQQTKEERKQRAKAAFQVSENIAKERENLVHQLHHLKDVNKNMMDRKVNILEFRHVKEECQNVI